MFDKVKAAIANNRKSVTVAVTGAVATVSTSANAALDQAVVDSIVAGVTSDAGIAIAAGFAILAVVLGGRVGFGLVRSFITAGSS